jgi:hypothetical protein
MTLTAVELKFILRLLGAPNYRAPMANLKPNAKTPAPERDRICMSLCSKGLVDYTAEVMQFAIAPAGRTLLNLDTTSLPVTPSELLVLRSCRAQPISPGKIDAKVPRHDRQWLIRGLAERGLVTIKKTQLKEAWLTTQGQRFMRDEYQPAGNTLVATGNQMNHYVQFLRQVLTRSDLSPAANAGEQSVKPDAQEILSLIQTLDQQWGTDNYLPLFYLRDSLQDRLARSELDDCLYDLQRQDKIELSTLQDVTAYSDTQLAAGIPQDMGGALFFVSVN